jgi:site-specific DNA-cytosine methylase
MRVLSLFDGISAGQLALQRAGIDVETYYASEIDKYAIQVTKKNFPNTIHLGDITKWQEWDIDWSSIDLVIGGSPCQGFSFAGKQLNFEDPRSRLFFVFVDICHRVIDENPKMKFLLENVRMKKEYQDVITQYMGVSPIAINSSLVSAQNRYRLYWTNIQNVSKPIDKQITFKDIIQDYADERYYYSDIVMDRLDVSEINLTGMVGYKSKGKEVDKCGTLLARDYKGMSNQQYPTIKQNNRFRKPTPIEYERLQTFPDNWTEGISSTQRYKALGNSWTVDVITHIFKNL